MLAPFLLFLGLFLGLAQNQQDKEYGGQDAGNGDFGGDGGLPIRCNMFNGGVGCRAVGNDRTADGVLPADSGFGQQLQQVAVIGILCFLQDPLTVATDTPQRWALSVMETIGFASGDLLNRYRGFSIQHFF